jgi:hypothetical protein
LEGFFFSSLQNTMDRHFGITVNCFQKHTTTGHESSNSGKKKEDFLRARHMRVCGAGPSGACDGLAWPVWVWHGGEDKGRWIKRAEKGLTRDGGACLCGLHAWVGGFGAGEATALADVVLCRRRRLNSNQISTIANGAFAGLTALTDLYDAGLWVGL